MGTLIALSRRVVFSITSYVPADDGRSHSQSGGLIGLLCMGRPGSMEAMCVREAYADYFVGSEGSMPWRSDYVANHTHIIVPNSSWLEFLLLFSACS